MYVDWFKIDLNVAKTSIFQYYKQTKNWSEWNYTDIVLKLTVKQVTFDSTKRPKLIENQLEILGASARKFRYFAGNSFSSETQANERVLLGIYTYLGEYNQKVSASPKNCSNFTQWIKKGYNWEHSSHIVKVGAEATC